MNFVIQTYDERAISIICALEGFFHSITYILQYIFFSHLKMELHPKPEWVLNYSLRIELSKNIRSITVSFFVVVEKGRMLVFIIGADSFHD